MFLPCLAYLVGTAGECSCKILSQICYLSFKSSFILFIYLSSFLIYFLPNFRSWQKPKYLFICHCGQVMVIKESFSRLNHQHAPGKLWQLTSTRQLSLKISKLCASSFCVCVCVLRLVIVRLAYLMPYLFCAR